MKSNETPITLERVVTRLTEHVGWLARLESGEWIDSNELPLAEIVALPSFWPDFGWHPAGTALGPMVAGRFTLWRPGLELVGFADTLLVAASGAPTFGDCLMTTAGIVDPARLPVPAHREALQRVTALGAFRFLPTDDGGAP